MEVIGTILLVAFAIVSMWFGCSNGKEAAERDFAKTETFKEWQESRSTAQQRINSAKDEARVRVEEMRRRVKEQIEDNAKLSAEVDLLESYALPTDEETDEMFSDFEKQAIRDEFCRWARRERTERWTEAERKQQTADKNKRAAEERLAVLRKSFWNKIGVSQPDDKQYREFLAKADEARKQHDEIVKKLQEEFFKIETRAALGRIDRVINGPHGDDGIESRLKILKQNARRMRKDAEELHQAQ